MPAEAGICEFFKTRKAYCAGKYDQAPALFPVKYIIGPN